MSICNLGDAKHGALVQSDEPSSLLEKGRDPFFSGYTITGAVTLHRYIMGDRTQVPADSDEYFAQEGR